MGTLVVYCENRPKNDLIEVGTLGAFVNMHVYKDVPGIEDTVKVGTPIPQGAQAKLPVVENQRQRRNLVMRVAEGGADVPDNDDKEALKAAMEPAQPPTKTGGSK